ncbi:hypothetical protein VOLCADRAFT_86865 [Volvox carteri f. nagariensis]|uniref:Uncharacterized protein n=1 Tax=Volvox carteri f. nagariensis TaxID=3068 RepID=D8TJT8_VOLCA|nr:uncharacterized protein VOLCADRAFT_86865 [Volvox carteri f. nagariensis]EFJ52428.1 hypothetical protein VOLCADRAFT_86865 [Volvox carteri f. nagariensis]|eukprot:XP_002946501.1 hypothetical protein VOLCADRAFT_86865 [Volvox carteri f. nagariensis]
MMPKNEARKYRDDFLAQHDAKPASTFLYNITAAIHEGDMPDRATATHAEVMQLWIAAAGSLRADTAIELVYDYGMDAGTVLKAVDAKDPPLFKQPLAQMCPVVLRE